jgi:hypothetical protein
VTAVILYAYAQHDAFILMPWFCYIILPPVFYATRLGCALLQYDRHAATATV